MWKKRSKLGRYGKRWYVGMVDSEGGISKGESEAQMKPEHRLGWDADCVQAVERENRIRLRQSKPVLFTQ